MAKRKVDPGWWVLFLLLGGTLYAFRTHTRLYSAAGEPPDVSGLIADKAAELGISAQAFLKRIDTRAAELGISSSELLVYQVPGLYIDADGVLRARGA